jgi:transposase
MPRRYPPEVRRQVIELARAGTRVKQLAITFGMSEATIYTWRKQDRIDRGELDGLSPDQAIELAAAKRRTRREVTTLTEEREILKRRAYARTTTFLAAPPLMPTR